MERSLYLILGLFGVTVFAQTLDPVIPNKERCALPKDDGTGEEHEHKYFYSAEDKVCFPFIYKGTGGNDNRFDSDRECVEACSDTFPALYPDGAEVCHLPMDQGLCLGRLVKYHFDTDKHTCRAFLYGGCTGNGNRFDTMEECTKTCRGKSGRSGTGETADPDANPDARTVDAGLIAGIVGGLIFAAAVITAIVVLIKNKRRGRKEVPTKEIEMS